MATLNQTIKKEAKVTGKQIAANLRANREKWTPYYYHRDGKYCVIGLKLMELGVPVEKWGEKASKRGIATLAHDLPDLQLLRELQNENDFSKDVDEVIRYCDKNADQDYPIEALAEFFGQIIPPEVPSVE